MKAMTAENTNTNTDNVSRVADGSNLHIVSQQWATRPDDQRYLTTEDLEAAVRARTENSKAVISDNKTLSIHSNDDILCISTVEQPQFLTHWTFGQLCAAVKAPASYLRNLPAPLAEINLNYGLKSADREENMLYINTETRELRAITSPTYGRIYDLDVVRAVKHVNEECNNSWVVPASSYSDANPKRATTLYASDRDVFIFLVDPSHPLEVNGTTLYRGFYVFNSEVGSKIFGLATFLYNKVCDNRIIWGVQQFQEVRIKHTSGAPERFIKEGKPMLLEYANSSAKQVEEKIERAQNIRVGKDKEEVQKFLKEMGFSGTMSTSIIDIAKAEEGDFRSAWDLAQGITAKARSLVHTDARVDLERKAGDLLQKVVGNVK